MDHIECLERNLLAKVQSGLSLRQIAAYRRANGDITPSPYKIKQTMYSALLHLFLNSYNVVSDLVNAQAKELGLAPQRTSGGNYFIDVVAFVKVIIDALGPEQTSRIVRYVESCAVGWLSLCFQDRV